MSGGFAAAACVALAILVVPRRGFVTCQPLRDAGLRNAGQGTARQLGGRRARRRAHSATVAEALRILDTVGPALRMGLGPQAALAHLAQTSPERGRGGALTSDLVAAACGPGSYVGAAARASPVGQVWSRAAAQTGVEELRLVAAAWTLADLSGIPLADAVDLAGRLLRESRARRARLDVLLAGPRATISLLTLLPLAGPLVGLLFGIDPVSLYAGSALTVLSAACGVALLLVGRVWCRQLLRRALSATVITSPRPAVRP